MTLKRVLLLLILGTAIMSGCSGENKLNEEKAKATIQSAVLARKECSGTLKSFGPVPALGNASAIAVPISIDAPYGGGPNTIQQGSAGFTISQDRKWYLTHVGGGGIILNCNARTNIEVQ